MHIRRLISLILVLSLLACPLLSLAEDLYPLETPAPARLRPEPEPLPDPPELLLPRTDPDLFASHRFKLDAKFLHIWFPNIRDCDEAVLMYDGVVWLIDCCSERYVSAGVDMMRKLGVTEIEKLFNSHPHYDHIDGLKATNEAFPVKQVLFAANFPADANETMVKARTYAEEASISVDTFKDGEVFPMGDGAVTLTFYYNEYDGDPRNMNDCSALTLLQYGSRRMLFMADMERNFGQSNFYPRLQAGLDLDTDIIKYPHHGNNGMLYSFWKDISPSLAVVTNSSYVKKAGMEFLGYQRVPVFYTSYRETWIHLYTDGTTWVAEYVPIADYQ